MVTFFFGVLFFIGVGLIVFRPLAKATGVPIYWEIGAGALLVVFFAVHLSSTYVQPAMMEEELAKRPCGEGSPQGLCYNLNQALCETAWASAESRCKVEVSAILKDRPSALVGPVMNRCRAQKMDTELRYNRANTDSAYCKSYFEFIERK